MALSWMSTFSIPTWNKFDVLGQGMSDEDMRDIDEYEGAPFNEHFEVCEQVEESDAPFDEHSEVYEEVSNQWFDWEGLDEKETEWGNHGIGKPFGDTLFDWDELEKEADCRMKALEDKNEARGWD